MGMTRGSPCVVPSLEVNEDGCNRRTGVMYVLKGNLSVQCIVGFPLKLGQLML